MKPTRLKLSRILTMLLFIMIMTGVMPVFVHSDVNAEGGTEETEVTEVSDWAVMKLLVSGNQNPVRIRVTKDLAVLSGNAHNTGNTVEIDLNGHTINGNGQQVFWNEKGSITIRNGTIKNAKSDFGGAINNRGTMTLENVDITNCSAIQGGGILNYGTLTMTGGSIKDCTAERGGGIRIVPHDSDTSAIARSATVVMTGVEISGNTATGSDDTYGRGGGIGVSNGTLTMTDCKVTGNKSTNDDGGGIDFDAKGKTLTLTNTEISNNSITHSERDGGGICLERGDAVITGCVISGNSAPDGGGIFIADSFGTAKISASKVTNNNATTYGGGGINNNAQLIINDGTSVSGNTSKASGGGIWTSKKLSADNVLISGNRCTGFDAYGGGIRVAAGTADLHNAEIACNTGNDGGGIYVGFGGSAIISGSSSVYENEDPSHGGGGITNKGMLTLKDDVQIYSNTSKENGGGIYHNGTALIMQDKVRIRDNEGSGTMNNVYLAEGKKITLTGMLDQDSQIGVTPETGYYVVTKNFAKAGNTDVSVFIDDAGRNVVNEDGEVRISVKDSPSTGGIFNRVTVTIHPAGQHFTLNIRDNGRTVGQNAVQLFNIGDTQKFWLTSADGESYYIDYFNGADDYSPSTKRFDIESNDNYMRDGSIVHVVKGHETALNKRWRFIRNDDGTYYVQNVRSGLYWGINDDGYANGRKLCQTKLSNAEKWEIEIVAADGEIPIEELKAFDSFTYSPYGEPVTSCDWMSHLPDDLLLSDVTIPGTHDAGTSHTSPYNSYAQCQNLSIRDQLYNGIRYFDMRFGSHEGYFEPDQTRPGLMNFVVTEASIIHGDADTCKFNGDDLTLTRVMEWVNTFLDRNPGETVILQLKEDRGGQPVRDYVYKYFKKIATENPERIYIGDHVPTMGECRGKIVLLSRLHINNASFTMEDGRQWAIDVSAWPERRDDDSLVDPLGLAASGKNYEVWDQDAYKKTGDDKITLIWNGVFFSDTGAQAKRDSVKQRGKAAWIVNYTSCSTAPLTTPQGNARKINPDLKDNLRESYVTKGLYLGVVCSDFTDEQLAYLVYKQNFINNRVVIRGVTVDGKEPFEPITVYVPKSEFISTRLNAMVKEIDNHFSNENYVPYGFDKRDEIGQLSTVPMNEISSAEEYKKKLANVYWLDSSVTLYVGLDTKVHADRLESELPKCGTVIEVTGNDWKSQTNTPQFETGSEHVHAAGYWAADEKGEKPYAGTASKDAMTARIVLSTDWGYRFDETGTGALTISDKDGSWQTEVPVTPEIFNQKPLIVTGIPVTHPDAHYVALKQPTCKEDGMKAHYHCETCGSFFLDPDCRQAVDEASLILPRTNEHTPGEPKIEKVDGEDLPTCTEAGAYDQVVYCEVCGKELSREKREVAALGHSWDEGTVTRDATCTEDGEMTYTCRNDASHTRTEVIKATGHDWGEWIVTREATESEEGEETRVCSHDESHVETRPIPVIGHVHELRQVERVEPTCEKDGNIEYWICDDCGGYFSDAEGTNRITQEDTILPGGHDWDEGTVTAEASCTEEGVITYTCRRDPSHTRTESIPMTGHQAEYSYEHYSDATCTQPEYQYRFSRCSICGRLFEVSLVEGEPALGHDWEDVTYTWSADLRSVTAERTCKRDPSHIESEIVKTKISEVPATCEETGEITYTAAFTNEAFAEQSETKEITALGHDWDTGTVTREATCTEDGEITYTCKNDASHTRTEVIKATGHIAGKRTLDDNTATCTQGGTRTVEEYCIVCGEVLSSETVETDPLGHAWEQPEYVWADDNSTVTATHTCETCGETESETVNTSHEDTECIRTWYSDPFENPCFEQQEKEEILPDKHPWGEWEVTKNPTCEEDGEETRTCDFDSSHTETRVIPKLGHDWDTGKVTREAACTEDGVKTYTCKRDPSHTRTEAIKALGHDWGEWTVTREATESEEGEETRTCGRCGETETRAIPVIGHVHELRHAERTEPTCEEDGNIEYWVCDDCGGYFSDAEGTKRIRQEDTILPALGHAWGEWTVTREATESEEGEETRTCSRCGGTETRAVPKPDPENISYRITAGEGQTWTKGSGKAAAFTFKRSVNDSETIDHFTGILVDGDKVGPSDYTARSGSVIVSLAPSYLETLSAGEHTLTTMFDDGEDVNAVFTVLEAEPKPDDEVPDHGKDKDPDKKQDGSRDNGQNYKPDNQQDNSRPGGQNNNPQESRKKPRTGVKTGDETGLLLWTFVLLGSLLSFFTAYRRRRMDQ